jgi:uncharacterized membrane protein
MAERARGERLDQPQARRVALPRPHYDQEAVGRGAESIARFFGTARYLVIQTVLVAVWIALNIMVITRSLRWDPYPFILLNLAFSTQAAYAAPLILLAQNRQADRDRVQAEEDRERANRNAADTEYLAREVAALRISMKEVATRDFLRGELQALLRELSEGPEGPEPAKPPDSGPAPEPDR